MEPKWMLNGVEMGSKSTKKLNENRMQNGPKNDPKMDANGNKQEPKIYPS